MQAPLKMTSLAAVLQLVLLFPAIQCGDEEILADNFAKDIVSIAEKYEANLKKNDVTAYSAFTADLSDDGNLLYQHMAANAPDDQFNPSSSTFKNIVRIKATNLYMTVSKGIGFPVTSNGNGFRKETVKNVKKILLESAAKYNHQLGTMNHWVVVRDLGKGLMSAGGTQGKAVGLLGTALAAIVLREDLKLILFNGAGKIASEKLKDVNVNFDSSSDTVKLSTADKTIAPNLATAKPAKITELAKSFRTAVPDSFSNDKLVALTKDAFANANGKSFSATAAAFRNAINKPQ